MSHFAYRVRAWFKLRKLRSVDDPKKHFFILRYKTHPFVFEEMILTAFKQAGFKIRRNKRYTGDGGIDGIVYMDGKKHLIQAKRYRNHINAAHVTEFAEICRSKGCAGLFIHTGKTGAQSWKNRDNIIDIISGQRMLKFIVERQWQY